MFVPFRHDHVFSIALVCTFPVIFMQVQFCVCACVCFFSPEVCVSEYIYLHLAQMCVELVFVVTQI